MTYKNIENMDYVNLTKTIEKDPICLIPIGVIEEHGPHLPLGTDLYLASNLCETMKGSLESQGHTVLISPGINWGLNIATSDFIGSFNIREDTFIRLLEDVLASLKKWGLKKIFLINVHGDLLHVKSILKAIENSVDSSEITIKYLIPSFFKETKNLTNVELSNSLIEESKINKTENMKKYLDVHAGGLETGLMMNLYPNLVNVPLSKSLSSSNTDRNSWEIWLKGGKQAKAITPNGYLGNPSFIDDVNVRKYLDHLHVNLSNLIIKELQEEG